MSGTLIETTDKVRPQVDDYRDVGGRAKQEPEPRKWPGWAINKATSRCEDLPEQVW